MKRIALVSIAAIALLSSCMKQDSMRAKYAGPKKISKYLYEKVDERGNLIQTIYDTTNIAELILWNNASDVFNDVTFTQGSLPAGWNHVNVGTGVSYGSAISWYMDFEKQKTFTFWSIGIDGNDYRQTYTLTKHTRNTLEMEAIYSTSNGYFHEVLTIEDL